MSRLTRIVSAFPCSGKTFATANNKNSDIRVLDAVSTVFRYDFSEATQRVERTTEFPNNYISFLKQQIGKFDIIFVSSHKELREALIENNLNYTAVVPSEQCLAEWIGRAYLQGKSDAFIENMKQEWHRWLLGYEDEDHSNHSYNIITLKPCQYLDVSEIMNNPEYVTQGVVR